MTVICSNKLNSEDSEIDYLAIGYNLSTNIVEEAVLRQLIIDEAHGELRCIDRNIYLLLYIRNRSDMILVAMGYNHTTDLAGIFLQIRNIRNDKIDAQHIIIRKC